MSGIHVKVIWRCSPGAATAGQTPGPRSAPGFLRSSRARILHQDQARDGASVRLKPSTFCCTPSSYTRIDGFNPGTTGAFFPASRPTSTVTRAHLRAWSRCPCPRGLELRRGRRRRRGASSGFSFFLGTAITPVSPLGPPRQARPGSGCCGCAAAAASHAAACRPGPRRAGQSHTTTATGQA